jgi:hypothetical protein
MGDIGTDGRVILKWYLDGCGDVDWIQVAQINEGFSRHGNEYFVSIKRENLSTS